MKTINRKSKRIIKKRKHRILKLIENRGLYEAMQVEAKTLIRNEIRRLIRKEVSKMIDNGNLARKNEVRFENMRRKSGYENDN